VFVTSALTVVAGYAVYSVIPSTLQRHGGRSFAPTIPFVILGVARYVRLVYRRGGGGSPTRALLIDEPAAGTGGTDMKRLADLLVDLRRRGVAVVVIEHHMDLIMAVADRIVVIDQGRKLAEGTPAEIQRNEAVLEAYLGRAA